MTKQINELMGSILPVTQDDSLKRIETIVNDLDEKHWLPFTRLPNVREFRVEIREMDEIFGKHGVRKRKKPILKYAPYNNKQCNRYMYHQLKRMS